MSKILSLDKNTLLTYLPVVVEKNLNDSIENVRYLGGGSNGKAFGVRLSSGEIIVLKAYRVAGMNEIESKQLKILSENTQVQMPKVLFNHNDDSIAVLGMTFIEGSNVLNPIFLFKNKSQINSFSHSVVKGMLDWHSVRGKKFGDLEKPLYSSWHDCYRENKVNGILSGIEKLVNETKSSNKKYELLCEATELYDKYEDEPKFPVLIHGDLNIMNIMADKKTFYLNGFIDPCGSMWADREYDLYQLQNMWGNKFFLYNTYKEMCGGLSKYSDFKVAYYGVMNEVSCRLGDGLVFPIWEDLWISRLRKMIKNIK